MRYRIIHYVVNFWSDFRVPVAAIVDLDDRVETILAPLPRLEFLGDLGAYTHIRNLQPELARLDNFEELPIALGPLFVLGETFVIAHPKEDCLDWVAERCFPEPDAESSQEIQALRIMLAKSSRDRSEMREALKTIKEMASHPFKKGAV